MAYETVKSAARAFEIIEVFRSEQRRLTAAQIGGLLDYPRSSLNVLLKSLVAQGYLSFAVHDQTYLPTLKVTQLGDWVPSALFNTGNVYPLLQELRNATSETVTLTVASGLQMRCLVGIMGTHRIGLQIDEGTQFPIFGTGVGTAYLTTLSNENIATMHRRAKDDTGGSRVQTLDEVLASVEKARTANYCTAYDAVIPDAGAIAMPLTVADFGESFVIAVAGLSSRIKANEDSIVGHVKQCALAIAGV